MDRPGLRYRNLATKCRHSAANAPRSEERAALLKMATAYDRKAEDIESDWKSRSEQVEEPLTY